MTGLTQPSSDQRTWNLLRIGGVWRWVFALGLLIAAVLIWAGVLFAQLSVLVRVVIGVVPVGLAVLSAWGGMLILRRNRKGRIISLILDYLAFVVCLAVSLQRLGVFVGIDGLAANFGRGLLPLLGLFIAYLIAAQADRFQGKPEVQERLQTIGKWVAIVSAVIFLLSVGLLGGLWAMLQHLLEPLTLIFVLLTAWLGFMVWTVGRGPAAVFLRTTNAQTEMLEGYLFLSPNFLGFLFFFAGPLLLSLYVSFTDWDAFGNKNWIGVENYRRIFNLDIKPLASPNQPLTEAMDATRYDELTRFRFLGKDYLVGAEDKLFWISMRNTLVFCLLAVPLSMIPALLLANVLNSKIPGMKFFRAVYFLPSVAATVGVAVIWQWLYNASVGYINYAITLGVNFLNNVFHLSIVDPQMRWMSDARVALLAIVIVSAWQTMGFNTVLFLAGLQNIPKELYEAAIVDGAGRWMKFWKITLPLLAPTTFYVVTTTTIQALQVFEQVFVMTNPPGSPNNSTLVLVLYLYQNGFQRFKQGYASAVAWVLFIVIFIVTLLQFRAQRKTGAYDV